MSANAPSKPHIRGSTRESERRCVTTQAQLRASKDGKTLSGYAAVYNSWSVDLGGFREKIAPGAFAPTLNAKPGDPNYEVVAVYQHNRQMVLGRRSSGTLRLSSDDTGLKVDVDLPNTTTGNDVRELVGRGDLQGMSFRFYLFGPNGDNWAEVKGEDGKTAWERTLLSVVIDDVCPVTDPAYEETSVEVRAKPPGAEAREDDAAKAAAAQAEADAKAKADKEAADAAAKAEADAIALELEQDEAALALA